MVIILASSGSAPDTHAINSIRWACGPGLFSPAEPRGAGAWVFTADCYRLGERATLFGVGLYLTVGEVGRRFVCFRTV